MKHEAQFQFQTTAPASAAYAKALIVADLKATFTTPDRWTQKVGTLNIHGESTHAGSSSAHSFDLWGAMFHSALTRNIPHPLRQEVMDEIALEMRHITGRPPAPWNDDPARTFDEVRELVDALAD